MSERTILIGGLPNSGKTTFLAALWHSVSQREIPTTMRFDSLKGSDHSHLNNLARRWRAVEPQERTEVGSTRLVSMNLRDAHGQSIRLRFPDLSGESFNRMWEDRECDPLIADLVANGARVMWFVHADDFRYPLTVNEEVGMLEIAGIDLDGGDSKETLWSPALAPTQVVLVDILQMLFDPPLSGDRAKIAIVLSAWDKVARDANCPCDLLRARFPLLFQYLTSGMGPTCCRVYGVSAQGGDLETEAPYLEANPIPSERVRVAFGRAETHDLTEPLHWLMQ